MLLSYAAEVQADDTRGYTAVVTVPVYIASWLIVAFLIGSVPFGWIVTRARGVDIRKVGSGNIGMTNVWRALGWKYGVFVLILDILKGLLPIVGLKLCLAGGSAKMADLIGGDWQAWLLMLVGIAAVLGHTLTPWLKFRGGKGVATGLGVTVGLMGVWVLAPVAGFALIAGTTRMVSLGSIMAALLASATMLTVPELRAYWPFAIAMPLLVLYTHRANIERILAGTENKIGKKPPVSKDTETKSDDRLQSE